MAGMPTRTLLALLLLLLPACGGLSEPEPEGPLTGSALVEELREGGYVLFLRHTETTKGGVDDISTLGDCRRQRELSDAGRTDAREIGAAFEKLEIPVAKVVASPFCRTVETAELAFGRASTEDALVAVAATGLDEATQQRALEDGRRLLATQPSDGSNVVVVGHLANLRQLAGAEPKEGGTVVFEPDGDGGFQLVAEVPPQGWQRLADRLT